MDVDGQSDYTILIINLTLDEDYYSSQCGDAFLQFIPFLNFFLSVNNWTKINLSNLRVSGQKNRSQIFLKHDVGILI